MIQFDEHIFQRGWFNHQLDVFFQERTFNSRRGGACCGLLHDSWNFFVAIRCDLPLVGLWKGEFIAFLKMNKNTSQFENTGIPKPTQKNK